MGLEREGATVQARGREPGSRGGGGQPASAGSEAPGQGLPQGQRDSLAPGRARCPHAGKGGLTQPGQAHRAAVPGSLPVVWERRWVPGAGCSVPACQERRDTVPRSTADRPGQPSVSQDPVPNHLRKSKLSTITRLSALAISLPKNPTLAGSRRSSSWNWDVNSSSYTDPRHHRPTRPFSSIP